MNKGNQKNNWSFVCHLSYGDSGSVATVSSTGNRTNAVGIEPENASDLEIQYKPVFLGVDSHGKAILLDPKSKTITAQLRIPADAIAAYAYPDPGSNRIWFMNDGDKDTGNDSFNCGDKGASVTVIDKSTENVPPKLLKTICVGRGHHVTTFISPTSSLPAIPRRAYVSNLMDGTISVIGNDPADAGSYLQVIDTINLCDPHKEEGGKVSIPNNAYPHGMGFSTETGKLYNLNNGYATIAVIDPVKNIIEETIELKSSSNLLVSPDGKYLIGKGVDRKTDPDHVIGKLSIIDTRSKKICEVIDLPDIYPSTYRFNADGSKLYVTSATTGKGKQKDNIKVDSILLFDTSKLPVIRLIKEVSVGIADCGRRPIAFTGSMGKPGQIIVPNPTDGTVTILDGKDESVIETVSVGKAPVTEFSFSFWDGAITGC